MSRGKLKTGIQTACWSHGRKIGKGLSQSISHTQTL